MKRYVLLLGGTGARMADALLLAASAGVFPASELEVLLVDTDRRGVRSVGPVRAKMEDYERIRAAVHRAASENGPFSVQMRFTAWPRSLPSDAPSLNQWAAEEGDDALLCQALFDRDAAGVDLHEGFHGRRMLGEVTFAGLLHEADQDPEDTLAGLVDDMMATANRGEEVRAVMVGSICGGTGAAGFAALGRYIRSRTENRVHLGAVMLGASTDQENAANAYEALNAYVREDLCETVGLLALPASVRSAATMDTPRLTDWLAVYMLDVLLHRPDWLTGLFTVRVPEGAASWRMFGQAEERYRLAYGRLMKTALLWDTCLGSQLRSRMEKPFFLRDGLLGWYAHFFRGMARPGAKAQREQNLELLGSIDRMMTLCMLWLGGISKTLPIDLRHASALQGVRKAAQEHYNALVTMESQLQMLDEDALNAADDADEPVYRTLDAEDALEAEADKERVEAMRREAVSGRSSQVAQQRKMGGTAAIAMLEDALEEAQDTLQTLRDRYREAMARIDHAQAIAAEEDTYRIDDARIKLQRLERHMRMQEYRVAKIQQDVEAARESDIRFEKPAMAPTDAENDMFNPKTAEKLLRRGQMKPREIQAIWPDMVRPGRTIDLYSAWRKLRHAPVRRDEPLISLLHACLRIAMLPGKEADK